MSSSSPRLGAYLWAGPGTIRMIQLKYFSPPIDSDSFLKSYSLDYLQKLKSTFEVTDVWVTYSWGFSSATEQEDYQFLRDHLQNFHEVGLKIHAYIQGTNLVAEEFPGKQWWARDNYGRTIYYHRGRLVTCLNSFDFQAYIRQKLDRLLELDVDGVFMDNVQMGQLGVPIYHQGQPFVFAGCACEVCRQKFRSETGYEIPLDWTSESSAISVYLQWRTSCQADFLAAIAQQVHQAGKEFGSNSYDPRIDSRLVYGIDIERIAVFQDYLLFENHNFPTKPDRSNAREYELAQKLNKPVFVLSYKDGIGFDQEYSQSDWNMIWSEAKHFGSYNLCMKATEFITQGMWHNLRVSQFSPPEIQPFSTSKKVVKEKGTEFLLLRFSWFRRLINRLYNPIFRLVMEKKWARFGMRFAYRWVIR